jgi:hypothetical protein
MFIKIDRGADIFSVSIILRENIPNIALRINLTLLRVVMVQIQEEKIKNRNFLTKVNEI